VIAEAIEETEEVSEEETVVATEEDLEVVTDHPATVNLRRTRDSTISHDLVVEMKVQRKCFQQSVQNVDVHAKSHSDQTARNQYFVMTVSVHRKSLSQETLLQSHVLTSRDLIEMIAHSEISAQQCAQ
jgi:hypothetical protein